MNRATEPLRRIVRFATRRSVLAMLVVLAVALWMASGLVARTDTDGEAEPAEEPSAQPFMVEVERRTAETIERAVIAQAETRPHRAALLRAQTDGQVAEVRIESGQSVERGEVLIRLERGNRDAELKEAQALVQQRRIELEAAQRLSQSGYQSRVQTEQARAALEQAQAQLSRVRQDIDYTTIAAPWAGTVDEVLIDVGDYLGVNGQAVTLVDNDPLTVVGHFPQSAADTLRTGQTAEITLLSGEVRTGPVTAVAPRSDAATRTFRVEAEIPNADGTAAGTSAEIRIVTGTVSAHRLSPALLSLNAQGELGVKALDADRRVTFHELEIVRTDPQGAWVTGLPDPVTLITRGGGFVAVGERVRTSGGAAGAEATRDQAATPAASEG
jgi:multidrug efflux system membrane fusion protein